MDENALIHGLIDIFEYKDAFQQQSSGIPPQDMFVLERIHFHQEAGTIDLSAGDLSAGDLSKEYGIPPSTLTGMLDRLEQKSLIRRIRSGDDRRALALSVTGQGKEILRRHIWQDRLFAANLFGTLPPPQKRKLLQLLEALLRGVKKEDLFIENEKE